MKRILDTVHGYILIDEKLVDSIIDTPCFQRLRRIEQTSIRSVYPSARHDRFIHSLGVYHIGSMIVDHLKKENRKWDETDAKLECVYISYLSACLLHDVAHSPFSHTFECYYGDKSELSHKLSVKVGNEAFMHDSEYILEMNAPAFHEFMSAMVAFTQYNDALVRLGADPEMVARMITGTYYRQEKDKHQIDNCFISLLHGEIIDADRLDYACRDVWASGYSTSSIDLRRLVSAIHIEKFDGDWAVCFESNSLNEIDGVLNVKDFQVRYVINHHSVNYEQWLLEEAAKHMAFKFCPNNDKPDMSLGNILCEETILSEIDVNGWRIKNLSDDDMIFLIKQDADNPYYSEWSSRQYSRFALWKSQDEFFHYFRNIDRASVNLKNNNFEHTVKEILCEKGLQEEDIQVNEVKFKPRVMMKSLLLKVGDDVVRYTDLYPGAADANKDKFFYYVYIKKNGLGRKDVSNRKKDLIEVLKEPLEALYNSEN